MRCPFCAAEETQVKDSRPTEDNAAIRRRRFCTRCDARFTTFERIQLRELTVIKKDGEKELFDRDKLQRSLKVALRKRPVDDETIEKIINIIVRELEALGENEISTGTIGEHALNNLRKLDTVAYIRYVSVYKDFNSTSDFVDFVDSLKN